MSKTIEEILAPKSEARLRIYAYSIDDTAHAGLLKVGQTTRGVKQRVAQQLKTAGVTMANWSWWWVLLPIVPDVAWILMKMGVVL